MVEAIQFDACKEFNGMVIGGELCKRDATEDERRILAELNAVNGRYFPMSHACGQFGKSCQDGEGCVASAMGAEDADNVVGDPSCPVDPDMELTTTPHPRYDYREGEGTAGAGVRRRPPPPLRCEPGDKTGYWDGYDAEFVRRVAYPSALGEVLTRGCCWWGRGARITRGTCAPGRVNRLLGRGPMTTGGPAGIPTSSSARTPPPSAGTSGTPISSSS